MAKSSGAEKITRSFGSKFGFDSDAITHSDVLSRATRGCACPAMIGGEACVIRRKVYTQSLVAMLKATVWFTLTCRYGRSTGREVRWRLVLFDTLCARFIPEALHGLKLLRFERHTGGGHRFGDIGEALLKFTVAAGEHFIRAQL